METAGMRALLDLEDAAPDVLLQTIGDTSAQFWPLARWPVSRAIAESDIGTTLPSYAQLTLARKLLGVARRTAPNPYSWSRAPRAEHLFVVSGWTKEAGSHGFVNWLSDDFAAGLGDRAIVVQDAYLDALSRGYQQPALSRQTYSYRTALERVERDARRHPLRDAEQARLRSVMIAIFDMVAFDVGSRARDRAINDALGRAGRVRSAESQFERLLDRVQPRFIHMQTAAYGTRSPQIRVAHERGIRVTEPQHGWIGSSHAAYNFGAAMSRAPLADSLPDTLLTYGEFWGQGIRFPGDVVPIGKPALNRLQAGAPPYQSRPKRLLFVASNYAHERVDEVLVKLRDALPRDWTVALRPHPIERATVSSTHARVLAEPRIEMDNILDATASISASRAVVGFSSTMLFEALAFGCHVAVVESPLAGYYAADSVFPVRINERPGSVEAVAAEFALPPAAMELSFAEHVWHSDAVSRFLDFVDGSAER